MMIFFNRLSVPGLLLLSLAQADAQTAAQTNAKTGYVVGVQPSNLQSVAKSHDLTVRDDLSGGGGPYLVNLGPGSTPQAVAADPNILSVEADLGTTPSETSPSAKVEAVIDQLQSALADSSLVPFYGSTVRSAYVTQPASAILNLPAAWEIATGSGIVAVIDTGVDPSHPAFDGVLVPGYDFTRNTATIPDEMQDLDPVPLAAMTNASLIPEAAKTVGFQLQGSTVVILDGSTVVILDGTSLPAAFGHGTITAGLIHLVAPTAAIMPLKAFKADGSANLSDIVRAIYFAVDHGAQLINMSFDIKIRSVQLQNAVEYATSHGVICIAAAGNEGAKVITYPAGLSEVIGVGSTNNNDQRSSFSNFGTSGVFMAAPGEALIAPFPGNNYAGAWGTSFSAALVSGTVASLLQLKPNLDYGDVTAALGAGVQIPSLQLGRDRLDVLRSLEVFSQKPSDPPAEAK